MKKILFVLPLIAGASWAGTSIYTSNQSQDAYSKLITQLDQMTTLAIESESYAAGFMHSTAITSVKMSSSPDAKVLIRLKHEIDHSPLGQDDSGTRLGGATIRTTLSTDQLDSKTRNVLEGFIDGVPAELFSTIDFSGGANHLLQVNAYAQNFDDSKLTFDGGQYEFTYQDDGGLSGNGNLGAVQFTNDDSMSMRINEIVADFDLQRVGDGFFTGTNNAHIKQLSYEFPMAGITVLIDDIGFKTDARIEGNNASGSYTISAVDIEAPLPVTDVALDVSIDKLSSSGIQNFITLMNEVSATAEADLNPMQLTGNLVDALGGLIQPGAAMDYRLTVSNAGGDMDGSVNVELSGDGSPNGIATIATVRDLLSVITAQVTLDADAEAVNLTPAAMLLTDPKMQTYVLDDGVKYTSDIRMADLILDINGEPLSLELMLGEMMDMPLDVSMFMQ